MSVVTVSCATCGIHMAVNAAVFNSGYEEYYCKFHNAAVNIADIENIIKVREKNIEKANADIELFKNQIEHFRKIQEDNPLQNVEQV